VVPVTAPPRIPFNRAAVTGQELENIEAAIAGGHLAADGAFTRRCRTWLEEQTGAEAALLVHSCTAALEIAAMLSEVGPGDEVIMPSYTFVSTANAFAIRGAVPVFVDIRPDTFNLDLERVAEAITPRTRCVVPVHYAGVGCEMEALTELAQDRNLMVIEDAAQGLMASYRDRPLGSFGSLATISFHETKNVTCGEGGALLVNDRSLLDRAELLREKGTDRSRFERGEVDKYTWRDIGSSYAMSELNAAFLAAQLDVAQSFTERRLAIWDRYHGAFEELERRGDARRPLVPPECSHNAHLYGLLLEDRDARDALIAHLKSREIGAVFHYVPLHTSPAGQRLGRAAADLPVTESVSGRLVRLPLWPDLGEGQAEVISAVGDFFGASTKT
jgi:dTDP-4-amino-4,6-dideoxygalactose transaminase